MGAGYIWFVGYGVITAAFALLLPISGLWAPEELGNPDEDFWAEFTSTSTQMFSEIVVHTRTAYIRMRVIRVARWSFIVITM